MMTALAAVALTSCQKKEEGGCCTKEPASVEEAQEMLAKARERVKSLEAYLEENGAVKEAVIVNNEQFDLANLKQDAEGYYILFDGTSLDGWRGYGKDAVPETWSIKDGCIHLTGSGMGEAQPENGGDLMFAHKFKDFELELEYRISKNGNSGIFYLAQEAKDEEGNMLPIWQSCSEFQVLDNQNHADAQAGKDGNRQSASLYDMVPAVPQNSKPYGEWNVAKIKVYQGAVWHFQNGEQVLEYHLWTPKWEEMLAESKFCKGGEFPYAYGMMSKQFEDGGYFALQDHGGDVDYRNIRIKVLE